MVRLSDAATRASIGNVTDGQWQFVIDRLEEESPDDRDYYVNRATLDMFREAGGDPGLIALLERALGDREDMDVRWERIEG